MKVGDRARRLVARGADPYTKADLAASRVSVVHRHGVSTAAALAVAVVALSVGLTLGLLTPDSVKVALRLQLPKSPIERHNDEILAAAGIDAGHALPADLPARLALSIDEIKAVDTLVRPTARPYSTLTGVLDDHVGQAPLVPSNVRVLQDFLIYLKGRPEVEWPSIMAEIAFQRSITDRARYILSPLASATRLDVSQLGELLRNVFKLSDSQRATLYAAGFPAVPADTNRQYLYTLMPNVSNEQASTIYLYLKDAAVQNTMTRVLRLLQSRRARTTRVILGLLADGRRVDTGAFGTVPSQCDVLVPTSCEEAP